MNNIVVIKVSYMLEHLVRLLVLEKVTIKQIETISREGSV